MINRRPINLSFTKFKFPVTAICSIAHRLSGVFLFLSLPFLLYLLQSSLASPQRFLLEFRLFQLTSLRFILWFILIAAAFHSLAGIRHIFLDLGFGESLKAARLSAIAIFLLVFLLTLVIGIWVW